MSKNYDLQHAEAARVAAPKLPYQPPAPSGQAPMIGLIGCGGITEHHLKAYRAAGWEVVAFYDLKTEAAEARKAEFFPQAHVCASVEEMLEREDVAIVDIATHPKVRAGLIEQAIGAGKHVLSQKPFAADLETGKRLVDLARAAGVRLAVNQNGRWAPYFSYLRQAVRAGVIGEVGSVHMVLNWDHTWTAGTPFEEIRHLMMEDFGIHWFDAARSFFTSGKAASVMASVAKFPDQPMDPPLLASAVISFGEGMATLAFNGCSRHGARETCTVIGTQGTMHAVGEICGVQRIEVENADGAAVAELEGSWFPDGFRGCMGELMCAIEEGREPEHAAEDNLKSLELVFAAMQSADEKRVVEIG